MEIVGIAASFIAIGQVVVAGRHVVGLLRSIPQIRADVDRLSNEISFLEILVEEVRLVSEQAGINRHPGGAESDRPILRHAKKGLEDVVAELKQILDECTAGSQAITERKPTVLAVKPKKVKWLLVKGRLFELRGRVRDAKGNLQTALQLLNLHIGREHHSQVMLCVEQVSMLTLQSPPPAEAETRGMSTGPDEAVQPDLETPLPCEQESHVDNVTFNADSTGSLLPQVERHLLDREASPRSSAHETMLVRTSIAIPGICPSPCHCQCHDKVRTQRSLGSGHLTQSLFGSLFVQYYGRPVFGRNQCNEPCCQRQSRSSTTFNLRLPIWFASRYITIEGWAGGLRGVGTSLRFASVIRDRTLYRAIIYENFSVVQQTLSGLSHIHPNDHFSEFTITPAELALQFQNYEALDILLQMWGSWLQQNPATDLARALAVRARSRLFYGNLTGSQRLLLSRLANLIDEDDLPIPPLHRAFINAIVSGEWEQFSRYLEDPLERRAVNWPFTLGETILHHVADIDSPVLLRQLILAEAHLDAQNEDGSTPLHIAVRSSALENVRCLLINGSKVDVADSTGSTALHIAMSWSSTDVVKLLLSKGASITSRDHIGRTPLHRAEGDSSKRIQEKLKLLVDAGADIDAYDHYNFQLWRLSITSNNLYALKFVVHAGSKVNIPGGPANNTILAHAARFAKSEILVFLKGLRLEHIDCEHVDLYGISTWDAFLWAIIYGPRTGYLEKSTRQPTEEEQEHFIEIYQGVRDRNLSAFIEILEHTLEHIRRADPTAAQASLGPLINRMEEWKRYHSVETFKTIALQIQEGMWDAAAEAVEENIELYKEQMASSPWAQKSRWDHKLDDMELPARERALRNVRELGSELLDFDTLICANWTQQLGQVRSCRSVWYAGPSGSPRQRRSVSW